MVVGYAIKDWTGNERARVAVDRDGCRLLDLSMEEADAMRKNRRVDERVRSVLTRLTLARAEA